AVARSNANASLGLAWSIVVRTAYCMYEFGQSSAGQSNGAPQRTDGAFRDRSRSRTPDTAVTDGKRTASRCWWIYWHSHRNGYAAGVVCHHYDEIAIG